LTEGDYKYKVNSDGNTVTIIDYIGSEKEINIPQQLDGKDVTIFDYFSFDNNKLRSVDILISVTTIGVSAFANNNLIDVVIPNSVKSIANYSFGSNDQLTNIFVQNPNTTIADLAFDGSNEQELTIWGHESSKVEDYATTSGYSFRVIPLIDGDYLYEVNDDGNTVTVIGYIGNSTDINIPEQIDGKDVTVIGREAFRYTNLQKVIIPGSVVEIEKAAFADNNLTSLEIPDSVTGIGEYVFSDNNLTSVDIPNS